MANELERKWLMTEAEWNRLCFPNNWQNATIIQSYLPTNVIDEQLRIRTQVKEGKTTFKMTRKSGSDVRCRTEIQQKLTEEMYKSLKEIAMHSLQKEKAVRHWDNHKYELNKIIDPMTHQVVCCMLEVEFKSVEDMDAFILNPASITVIEEVTYNSDFQLVNMSELVYEDKWIYNQQYQEY